MLPQGIEADQEQEADESPAALRAERVPGNHGWEFADQGFKGRQLWFGEPGRQVLVSPDAE